LRTVDRKTSSTTKTRRTINLHVDAIVDSDAIILLIHGDDL